MIRTLIDPQEYDGTSIRITNREKLHHLSTVRRAQVGAAITCTDGQGTSYIGRIEAITRGELCIRVERIDRAEATPGFRVTIAAALIKPARFDWLVEKTAELGAAKLVPLVTDRTTIQLDPLRREAKIARWQRIADEALQQCGRTETMMVEPISTLKEFFARTNKESRIFIPTLDGERHHLNPYAGFFAEGTRINVVALIGPEGDFTPGELKLAVEHGAVPITLGPLTLRSETAAAALLAVLQYSSGQW